MEERKSAKHEKEPDTNDDINLSMVRSVDQIVEGKPVIKLKQKEKPAPKKAYFYPTQLEQINDIASVTGYPEAELIRIAWDFFYEHHFVE